MSKIRQRNETNGNSDHAYWLFTTFAYTLMSFVGLYLCKWTCHVGSSDWNFCTLFWTCHLSERWVRNAYVNLYVFVHSRLRVRLVGGVLSFRNMLTQFVTRIFVSELAKSEPYRIFAEYASFHVIITRFRIFFRWFALVPLPLIGGFVFGCCNWIIVIG